MKTKLTLCTILAFAQISFAQEKKVWLSLGAGIANTSSANKNNLLGNGTNLQAEAFVPLYRKGWDGSVKGSGFMMGLNVSGNYTSVKNLLPNNAAVAGKYQVYGGNLSVASQAESTVSGSFSGLLGVEGRITLGKVNFSPSINAGYLSFNQKGFTQEGSANINGQQQQRDLVKADNQSTKGLVWKPQVKIGYNVGQNFTFFVSPAMLLGPEIKQTVQYLVPQGGFNDKNTYEVKQLASGTWDSKTNSSRYTFTEINFGVSVAIGRKKAPKTMVKPSGAVSSSYAKTVAPTQTETADTTATNQRISMNVTTPKQTQGRTFGESIASGLQTEANTVGQGASLLGGATPKGSTTNLQKNEAQDFNTTRNNKERGQLAGNPNSGKGQSKAAEVKNPLYEDKGTNGNNPLYNPNAISKNSTNSEYGGATGGVVNKQTQGQNFGEKVAGGLQTGANVVGQGASLLGGAIPKGSTANLQKNEAQDFNTTRNNKERGQLAVNPTDEYGGATGGVVNKQSQGQNFGEKVATGMQPAAKGITEKGIKRTASAMAAPGNPIGGIIVKGGKNPGGNLRIVSNSNGEVLLNKLTKGSYLFQLNEPSGKSINEKGVKRLENAMAAPGQPIGGIVVKGGKNPRGSLINLTVNDKGQIGFEVLESGNYKLIIQTPEAPKTEGNNEKKVVEKATSGLKDTLKTNV